MHGDHGIVEDSFGPYRSEEHLIDALQASGVFRRDM